MTAMTTHLRISPTHEDRERLDRLMEALDRESPVPVRRHTRTDAVRVALYRGRAPARARHGAALCRHLNGTARSPTPAPRAPPSHLPI